MLENSQVSRVKESATCRNPSLLLSFFSFSFWWVEEAQAKYLPWLRTLRTPGRSSASAVFIVRQSCVGASVIFFTMIVPT